MKAFAKLFLREWKYLLKRPRSLVLMIFIPIFVTCICGSSYEKGYFSDLKMGVVDYSYSKQTREVVEAFRQSPYFDIVGYYGDEEEIAEAMRNGEIVGCLIFPADFTRNLQLGQQAEALSDDPAVDVICASDGDAACAVITYYSMDETADTKEVTVNGEGTYDVYTLDADHNYDLTQTVTLPTALSMQANSVIHLKKA